MRPCRAILDVGCGDGARYASDPPTTGSEPHGIDISSVAVEADRARGIAAQVASLDERLPLPDCVFDAVLCLEVFECLDVRFFNRVGLRNMLTRVSFLGRRPGGAETQFRDVAGLERLFAARLTQPLGHNAQTAWLAFLSVACMALCRP